MPSQIRPYEEGDREMALDLLGGDARTIDTPQNRVLISEDGQGAAVWMKPDASESGDGILGAVVTKTDDRPLFFSLLVACAQDMLDHGVTHGSAIVHDKPVVDLLKRRFPDLVEVLPVGRNPSTGEMTVWELRADAAAVVAVLGQVT